MSNDKKSFRFNWSSFISWSTGNSNNGADVCVKTGLPQFLLYKWTDYIIIHLHIKKSLEKMNRIVDEYIDEQLEETIDTYIIWFFWRTKTA